MSNEVFAGVFGTNDYLLNRALAGFDEKSARRLSHGAAEQGDARVEASESSHLWPRQVIAGVMRRDPT
jgi:hypothetical protein